MRYFLDTEFNGFGGALMSIALVPRDVRRGSFYRVVEMKDPLDPWVAQHVVPILQLSKNDTPAPRAEVAEALAAYLREDKEPIIVADWPTDFEHLMSLLITGPGQMESIPDLRLEFCRLRGWSTSDDSAVPHNAFCDAVALRDYCVKKFGY